MSGQRTPAPSSEHRSAPASAGHGSAVRRRDTLNPQDRTLDQPQASPNSSSLALFSAFCASRLCSYSLSCGSSRATRALGVADLGAAEIDLLDGGGLS